jgi:hypothetical protein
MNEAYRNTSAGIGGDAQTPSTATERAREHVEMGRRVLSRLNTVRGRVETDSGKILKSTGEAHPPPPEHLVFAQEELRSILAECQSCLDAIEARL